MSEEKLWLEKHFSGRKGKLLELGAYDGITESLTKDLIANGWSANLVEANPGVFLRLFEEYKHNHNIQLIHATISQQGGIMPWWDAGAYSQVSTLDQKHRDYFITKGCIFQKYLIGTITIKQLLEHISNDFDLVIIDLEGVSIAILNDFLNHTAHLPEIICVEAHKDDVTSILSTYKYEVQYSNLVNTIAKKIR